MAMAAPRPEPPPAARGGSRGYTPGMRQSQLALAAAGAPGVVASETSLWRWATHGTGRCVSLASVCTAACQPAACKKAPETLWPPRSPFGPSMGRPTFSRAQISRHAVEALSDGYILYFWWPPIQKVILPLVFGVKRTLQFHSRPRIRLKSGGALLIQ